MWPFYLLKELGHNFSILCNQDLKPQLLCCRITYFLSKLRYASFCPNMCKKTQEKRLKSDNVHHNFKLDKSEQKTTEKNLRTNGYPKFTQFSITILIFQNDKNPSSCYSSFAAVRVVTFSSHSFDLEFSFYLPVLFQQKSNPLLNLRREKTNIPLLLSYFF